MCGTLVSMVVRTSSGMGTHPYRSNDFESLFTIADCETELVTDQEIAEAAEITAFWTRLGLPGLIDVHVHFMPDNVLAKVWAYFDAGREAGRPWPIAYRLPQA